MKSLLKYCVFCLFVAVFLTACEKEYESIEELDDRAVSSYISKNNLSVTEYSGKGFYYQVLEPGKGPELDYSDKVPMMLTIRSLDGYYVAADTFATSNRYYNFLGYFTPDAIRIGVKEVLKRSSGTIRLIVPSRLAFGRNGAGNIPGNASLDITAKVLTLDKMPEYEDYLIRQYLTANGLSGFTKTASGMYYKVATQGTGSPITTDSTIVAEYTGKMMNGKIFDQQVGNGGATFPLASEIAKGWKEGVPLIKEGGSIRLVMPSTLAYGYEGSGSTIPPFMPLDFDIKVKEVRP